MAYLWIGFHRFAASAFLWGVAALFLFMGLTPLCFGKEQPDGKSMTIRAFETLKQWAETLSTSDYVPPPPLPEAIDQLTYDDYRMIAFRHPRAVWFQTPKPFWLEMFHRGFVHKTKVEIGVISKGQEHPLPFSSDYFEYRGPLSKLQIPEETGFAGLRVVGAFPGRTDHQEMLTFLGASYFRALVNSGVYGTSARGIAINIGAEEQEEFPEFQKFWVVEPKPGDDTLTILALLEGPSVCGAYRFEFHPQEARTEIDVAARLFFRKKVAKVGIAPLTSMWMWGDGIEPPPLDHRPEVHDSDGLLIQSEGEWTFRSLSRQSYPSVSRLEFDQVEGFGLLQRETRYSRYQDDEAKYHLRPSLWIRPKSPFLKGRIELLELPGVHEGIDNIAAYWVPRQPQEAGTSLDLEYRVSYFKGNLPEHAWLGRVTDTEIIRRADKTIEVRVGFEGKALSQMAAETPLRLDVTSVRAQVVSQKIQIEPNGKRIAQMIFKPEGNGPIEIQAVMKDSNRNVTETWRSLCPLTVPEYKFPQVYTRME